MNTCRSMLLFAGVALGTVGCGNSSAPAGAAPHVGVVGEVRVDGKPMKEGSMQFQLTGGADAAPVVAEIRDGHYEFQKANGPPAGKHKVVIAGAKSGTGSAGKEWKLDVELPAGEAIPYDFDLKSNGRATYALKIKK